MSEIDVTLAALEAARRPLTPAETKVRDAARAVDRATMEAGNAAGDGPLTGVLGTFGGDVKVGGEERADALRQLGQDIDRAAGDYRDMDAGAAENNNGAVRGGG